jgi:PBSX family phage portal protein
MKKKKSPATKTGMIDTPDGMMEVKMHVLKDAGSNTAGQSMGLDPFATDYSGNDILAPPNDPMILASMVEYSSVLHQCVKVMATNVVGFGYDLDRNREYKDEDSMPQEASDEKQRLRRLWDHPNHDTSFSRLMKAIIKDYETVGMAYLEVVRNRAGEIDTLHYLPAFSMRMCKLDKEFTTFTQPLRNDDGTYEEVERKVRFRRYVQRYGGNKKVYFKSFHDPRTLSAISGKWVDEGGQGGTVTRTSMPANEVIVFKQDTGYTTYGQPRWLATAIKLYGSRMADEVNWLYFENKTVPPMVITVSGGTLTDATVEKMTEMWSKEVKGLKNYHNALVLEAVPAQAGVFEGEKISPVKIDIKPLTQAIEKDGQFLEYNKRNEETCRADFGLPGIYFGREESYNRATAVEAARVVEEQVFGPERYEVEHALAVTIMADMRAQYWTLTLLGAKTSDWVAILGAISGVKGMIPIGVVQKVVNRMLGEPTEDIPEDLMTKLISELQQLAPPPDADDKKPPDEAAEEFIEKIVDVTTDLRKRLTYLGKEAN